MFKDIAKMKKSAKKAEEELAQREREQQERSAIRARVIESEILCELAQVTQVRRNEGTTQTSGVFSRFFQPDRMSQMSQLSSNACSQDGFVSTPSSQSYYDKQPNLRRLRGNVASTAIVPSRPQNSSLIRMQPNSTMAYAKAGNTAMVPSRPQDSSLIRKHPNFGKVRSTSSSFVPEYFVPEYFMEPDTFGETTDTRSNSFQERAKPPASEINLELTSRPEQIIKKSVNGGRGRPKNLGDWLLAFNVDTSSDEEKEEQDTRSLQLYSSSHNVGPQASVRRPLAQPSEEEIQAQYEKQLRGRRPTGGAESSSSTGAIVRRLAPERSETLSIHQYPTGFTHQYPTGFTHQYPTGFTHQYPTSFTHQYPTSFTHQYPTTIKLPADDVSFYVEPTATPIRQRENQIVVRRDEPINAALPIKERQDQKVVRRDECASLAVLPGKQQQIQTLKKPKQLFRASEIFDVFRGKQKGKNSDDKRKGMEKESKDASKERNERPLVEAGATTLRRKQETPAETQLRQETDDVEGEKEGNVLVEQPPSTIVACRSNSEAVSTEECQEQSVVREVELPLLPANEGEQLQIETFKKPTFKTSLLLDIFRHKKSEENPDDRRKEIQRESKKAWRENNERRLVEAAATSLRRKEETAAETNLRQQKDAASHALVRSQETDGETEDRRRSDAASHALVRSQETDTEREQRLAVQAIASRKHREEETDAETEERRRADATSHALVRSEETDAQRLQRVANSAAAMRDKRAGTINNRIREIQRVQRLLQDNNDERAISKHHCGDMNVICPFCRSRNFPEENTQFTKCCRKGKLIIPVANNEEYPKLLQDMMSDPSHPDYANFREHIRNYNSSVSFASIGAKIIQAPGHGPYCFKVQGTVYHKTSHVQARDGYSPQYAQLYILDRATQVVQTAIQHPSNVNNIVGDVLYKIVDFMRQHNRIAASYRMMAEVLKAEEEKARRDNTDLPVINMVMRRNRSSDVRRYNLPLENEVAMVFVGEHVGEPPFQRDIQIYPKNPTNPNNHFIKINILSANLDPMTYAILFPYGQPGWHEGLVINGFKTSMPQYKQALLAIRDTFNPIISAGRLTQQWIVDSYLQVEANNLNYIRNNQKRLRAEDYSGLRDYVNKRAANAGLRAGQPIILPSTFEGSPRNMRERLQDAMSIFAKFGAVDAFITFTANPAWPEIVDNLQPGQTSSDRPDLIARVFELKLKALIEDITVNHVLGRTVAWVYTIEFQKRGLPHAHILVVFSEADKFKTADRIDAVVCAEIPDRNVNPELYSIVVRNMIHGPCGIRHPNAPCMQEGKCSKDFPKAFQPITEVNTPRSAYGVYRRRDNKRGIMKSGTWLDNRYVVPYNPYLLLKYNAHINVEVCTSMKAVKYIYKYIYKGFDCANIAIGPGDANDRDVIFNEIDSFIDARYISAPEGMWRLLENHMHGRSIPVIKLPVHLPDEQRIYYQEGEEAEAVARAAITETKLTAWFKLNELDASARQYRYTQIPEYYTFNKGTWERRQRGRVLPRIYSVAPSDQERFCLRLLLLHVPGATSFKFLRTVDGIVHTTFRDGALHRQLLSDDREWYNFMNEAKNSQMPAQMRQTLAFIYIFCAPRCPEDLFNDFIDDLTMDFRHRDKYNADASKNLALHHIESILKEHRKKCTDFGLPAPSGTIEEARNYQVLEEKRNAAALIPTLNAEQKAAFDKIVEGIEQPSNGRKQKLFFLNGPGGSGKTYLYNALISYVRGQRKIVNAYATTGIASTLIKGGTTVHSGFGIPLKLTETSTSQIKSHYPQAQALKEASLLIIDECTMLTSNILRIIETLLKREIMQNNEPFGGKVLVLGGDFRQTLPVVPGGRRVAIIESCLIKNTYWREFEHLSLISNMRSSGQNAYNKWLLDIGKANTGVIDGLSNFAVNIPNNLITEDDIVEKTFSGNIESLSTDELSKRCILCSTNKEALAINNSVIAKLSGEIRHYYSADTIDQQDKDDINDYTDDFLHEQQPSGMPPHAISLKRGAIVMLLRNLNRKMGLCNGTRMVVVDMRDTYIQCEIISDFRKGDKVFLSRLDLTPSETNLPFQLRRRQFPILPAFAMTINKSQGQTFNVVGIHLNDPVFAHGQLYVALSRSRDPSNIKVFINEGPKQGTLLDDCRYFTENIVYKEVFEGVE